MDDFNRRGDMFNNNQNNMGGNPYQSRYPAPSDPNMGRMDRTYQPQQPMQPQAPVQPIFPQNGAPSYPQQPYRPVYTTQPIQPQNIQPNPGAPIQFEQQRGQLSNQDFEDQFDYARQQPIQQQRPQQKKKGGFFSFMRKTQEVPVNPMAGKQYLRMATPRSIEDVKGIINVLQGGDPVIVDCSRINEKESQRVIDYLAGAVFALGGTQQAIGEKKFALTPGGMGIVGNND